MAAAKRKRRSTKKRGYWSAEVTRKSNALDLKSNIFKSGSPRRIASSLKRSAEASKRRKGTPLQSAMSMLSFYINRAGSQISPRRKRHFEKGERRTAA